VVSIDSFWFPLVPMDICFEFKGPSLFKKHKRVFSVQKQFFVERPVIVDTAENLCHSGALEAAITVIAACRAPLPLYSK
jgi:hypothetical protein